MLWIMMMAVALGQAPPATQPTRTPPGPPRGPRISVSTRPTEGARRVSVPLPVSAATRPATGAIGPAALPMSVSATRPTGLPPAGLAAQLAGPDVGLSGDPVQVEATADGIMVIANAEDARKIQALIAQLGTQPGLQPTFKVFQVKNAQAADIASKVAQLWNQAYQPVSGGTRPEYRVNIIPEPRANILMIATPEQNMARLTEIIEQLDQPSLIEDLTKRRLFEPIPLQHIKAVEAEAAIRDLLTDLNRRRGAPQAEPATIRADPRTNSLLVSASQADFEQIQKLVQTLDVPPSPSGGGSLKLALYPLKKAAAKALAAALNEMLTGQAGGAAPTGGGGSPAAMKEQVRRLQMVNMRAPAGQPVAELDLEKPIKVWGEEGTNSIIYATIEANLEPMSKIIEVLDSVPLADELQVRVFVLAFADAEPLSNSLKNMFSEGARLREQPDRGAIVAEIPTNDVGAALSYPIGIAFDKRNNALIVSGRAEQLALIEETIRKIDVKSEFARFVPRLVRLKHADVKAIADLMTRLGEQRQKAIDATLGSGTRGSVAEAIVVIPDVRTNSLVVVARPDNIEDVVKLATELDNQENAFGGPFQIITLQNVTAVDIADKVTQLWKRRNQLRQQANLPADEPTVVADARSNSLIVSSNPEDAEAIVHLVKQLEEQKLSPMMEIRTLLIRNNDARTVGEAIQNVFDKRLANSLGAGQKEQPGDRVTVVTDPLTRTLIIASNKSNYDEIVRLVAQLDVLPDLGAVIRTYTIRNADVTKVTDTITKLFAGGVFQQGTGASKEQLPEAFRKVTVVSDERSSSIIVSASPDNLALVDKLIQQLDQPDTIMFAGVQLFKIENADVVRVADLLDQLMQGIQQTITDKTQMQFKILPDPRTRMLLVSGTRLAIKQAESLVPRLDVVGGAPGETRVFALKQATARQLEPILTDLFEKTKGGGGTQTKATPVLVQAVEGSNSLIVTGAPEDLATVAHLLEMLDQPSNLAKQMRIFPLKEARADEMSTTLTDLIRQQGTGGRGSAATPPPIAVTPEGRTNSLVVFAPPDLMANVEQIIQQLDTNKAKTSMALQVFRLNNARADDLSKRLQDFFQQASSGGGGGRASAGRQMLITFPWKNPDTGVEEQHQLVYQDVTLMPDPATNSLTVLAPQGSIEMMQHLVEMLDNVELVTAKVQVFQLRNADAEKMKTIVEELLKGATSRAGGQGQGQTTRLVLGEGGGAAGPAAAGEAGAAVDLTFSVDTRTNSLIAAGSPANLRTVEDLVYKLDYTPMEDRIFRVVHLLNAKADDIETAMQAYFDKEAQRHSESAGQGESKARQIEREVTVQSAGETQNTILLSYSPRMESAVFQMIKELDLPPPQVMIQVLMAEVTLDDRLEMGMEFALQDLTFSEHSFVDGHGVLQGAHFDKIFGTDVGAQGQSSLGGISFTITGEDFNFLVRALQTEGRLEVLNRPAILVQDNQEANFTVGESIPIVSQITVSTGGVVTPSVDYQDVGIKLLVTPIINPDGFVNMEIETEISSVAPSSISVGSGVSLPILSKRNARTSVTVKDGETIIIGGLITNRETDSENKVPLAGDIPILGNLFRATVKTHTKTELLMVLTPHVIRDAEQARRMSIAMRDQTGLMDNARRSPMMNSLQVKPDEELFGPAEPTTGPAPGDQGEPYGPLPDEYGPPVGAMQKGEEPNTLTLGPPRSLSRSAKPPAGK